MSLDTAVRLRRLLAILAWMAQVGEAPIDEVAQRFDLTPEALVTELELAACCGVPPYTPDQLMEIVVTDTTVSVRVGTSLGRPRRLSPAEGFALATSARALLAVPGSDETGALSRLWPNWTRPSAVRKRGTSGWNWTRPPCSRWPARPWPTGGPYASPTTRPPLTGSPTGRSLPSECSPARGTGISTPGVGPPGTCAGSGSTGSVQLRSSTASFLQRRHSGPTPSPLPRSIPTPGTIPTRTPETHRFPSPGSPLPPVGPVRTRTRQPPGAPLPRSGHGVVG